MYSGQRRLLPYVGLIGVSVGHASHPSLGAKEDTVGAPYTSAFRNATEFARVSAEEVRQSLRTASRDGANCIGNAASLFIAPSFR
jgi:hypothetical protein